MQGARFAEHLDDWCFDVARELDDKAAVLTVIGVAVWTQRDVKDTAMRRKEERAEEAMTESMVE